MRDESEKTKLVLASLKERLRIETIALDVVKPNVAPSEKKRVRVIESDDEADASEEEQDCFEVARVICKRARSLPVLEKDDATSWEMVSHLSTPQIAPLTALTKTAIVHMNEMLDDLGRLEERIRAQLEAARNRVNAVINEDYVTLGALIMAKERRTRQRDEFK